MSGIAQGLFFAILLRYKFTVRKRMCDVHTETAILNALFLTLFTASHHLQSQFKLKGNPVSQDIWYPPRAQYIM